MTDFDDVFPSDGDSLGDDPPARVAGRRNEDFFVCAFSFVVSSSSSVHPRSMASSSIPANLGDEADDFVPVAAADDDLGVPSLSSSKSFFSGEDPYLWKFPIHLDPLFSASPPERFLLAPFAAPSIVPIRDDDSDDDDFSSSSSFFLNLFSYRSMRSRFHFCVADEDSDDDVNDFCDDFCAVSFASRRVVVVVSSKPSSSSSVAVFLVFWSGAWTVVIAETKPLLSSHRISPRPFDNWTRGRKKEDERVKVVSLVFVYVNRTETKKRNGYKRRNNKRNVSLSLFVSSRRSVVVVDPFEVARHF